MPSDNLSLGSLAPSLFSLVSLPRAPYKGHALPRRTRVCTCALSFSHVAFSLSSHVSLALSCALSCTSRSRPRLSRPLGSHLLAPLAPQCLSSRLDPSPFSGAVDTSTCCAARTPRPQPSSASLGNCSEGPTSLTWAPSLHFNAVGIAAVFVRGPPSLPERLEPTCRLFGERLSAGTRPSQDPSAGNSFGSPTDTQDPPRISPPLPRSSTARHPPRHFDLPPTCARVVRPPSSPTWTAVISHCSPTTLKRVDEPYVLVVVYLRPRGSTT